MMKLKYLLAFGAFLASGCATASTGESPSETFFTRIKALCGKHFEGRAAGNDPSDADFKNKRLLARVDECTDNEVRIAFDVGEDRSRTWIVTRTTNGLRLKHRHLLKDGSVDPVSNYGGDTSAPGTAEWQQFPADQESKDMFEREGRTVSLTNVWSFELIPGETLTYELARPGRLFQVTFDLSKPVKGD